jgi:hypothetical protein
MPRRHNSADDGIRCVEGGGNVRPCGIFVVKQMKICLIAERRKGVSNANICSAGKRSRRAQVVVGGRSSKLKTPGEGRTVVSGVQAGQTCLRNLREGYTHWREQVCSN